MPAQTCGDEEKKRATEAARRLRARCGLGPRAWHRQRSDLSQRPVHRVGFVDQILQRVAIQHFKVRPQRCVQHAAQAAHARNDAVVVVAVAVNFLWNMLTKKGKLV